MKYQTCFMILAAAVSLTGCTLKSTEKRTVMAIPVYGQSLALGEEAVRITDFDSLCSRSNHRVLTENLDEEFGYLSDTHFKQWMKKVINDRHRAFELPVYGMSEQVIDYFDEKGYGDSVVLCIFPGGRGATSIVGLGKGTAAYEKFLAEIRTANDKARDKGWNFVVPAFLWLQGEDDILWKKSSNYKKDLKALQSAFNQDIKAITKQVKDVVCISYQTNCLTLAEHFDPRSFSGKETSVPQGQLELIQQDPLFMGMGPTYPYSFVDERVHIDGLSHKRLGHLAGLSVVRLLQAAPSKGLVPERFSKSGDTVIIKFSVPKPPLVFDTMAVAKAAHFGFSIIDSANTDIIKNVYLDHNLVKINCTHSPAGCKVRYAVNGIKGKSGYRYGPRGNLRDSQGEKLTATIQKQRYPLHNWSYQFDVMIK